jgi:hypothetical protein
MQNRHVGRLVRWARSVRTALDAVRTVVAGLTRLLVTIAMFIGVAVKIWNVVMPMTPS